MPSPTLSDDIRLLLDENLSPNIAPRLWDDGIDALPVRDRAMRGSADHTVFQFAQKEHRAVATIDEFDFRKLVLKSPSHWGIAVIPNRGTRDEQYEYLMGLAAFLRATVPAMDAIRNRIVSISTDMQISSQVACAEPVDMPVVATTVRLKPIA